MTINAWIAKNELNAPLQVDGKTLSGLPAIINHFSKNSLPQDALVPFCILLSKQIKTNANLANPIDLLMKQLFGKEGRASEVFNAAIKSNDVEGVKALAPYIDFDKIDLDTIPLENSEIIAYLADQVKDKSAFYNHLEQRWVRDNQPNGGEALKRIWECRKRIRGFRRLKDQRLDLNRLNLSTFPLFLLRDLPNLEVLVLSGNQLTSFPVTPGVLPALTHLYLNGNQLASFPVTPGAFLLLRELYLDNNQLASFPVTPGVLPELRSLRLSRNQLTSFSVTPEVFLLLRELYLDRNQLASFPVTPGVLPALMELYLSRNQLTSFPVTSEVFLLLSALHLDGNQLASFPVTPGVLPELRSLHLSGNQLASFPVTSGVFPALMELYLSRNQLTSFPVTSGGLRVLRRLTLVGNDQLLELPLSLQSCTSLMYLEVNPALQRQAQLILTFTKEVRSEEGLALLPAKVSVWNGYGGIDDDLSFVAGLEDANKRLLYEWLHRLEDAQEFKSAQKNLAEIVCKILASLNPQAEKYSPEFAESFYTELIPNLERCGDRAAETLNLVYAAWITYNLPEKVSDKEKLEILVKAAKAFALTKGIANKLKNQPDQRENVEVYLFYKILFSDTVLTAVKTMLHSEMGDRRNNPNNPITEAELQKFIDENYWNELTDLIPFKNLILKNKDFQAEYGLYLEELERDETSSREKKQKLDLPLLKEAEGFPTKEDKTLFIQKQLMIKHAKIIRGIEMLKEMRL